MPAAAKVITLTQLTLQPEAGFFQQTPGGDIPCRDGGGEAADPPLVEGIITECLQGFKAVAFSLGRGGEKETDFGAIRFVVLVAGHPQRSLAGVIANHEAEPEHAAA